MATSVKYNGTEITPTPFVVRNGSPVDAGGQRWGYTEAISLEGVLTGQVGTGKISEITSIFSNSYKTLTVESAGDSSYMTIPNCVVKGISIGANQFAQETDVAVPYAVSLMSFQNTSGVTDVSDQYSYNEGENGIVSITHQIGAKGVHDGNDPIDNAYNFVSLFTGTSPLNTFSPRFISGGEAFLVGSSEKTNRTEGSYSVSQQWSYETGSVNPYTTQSTVSVSKGRDLDFPTIDLSVNFVGAVTGSIDTLRTGANSYDYFGELEAYGFNTGSCYLNSFNVTENDPSTVAASVSFLSGFSAENTTGAWRHTISLDWDEVEEVQKYSLSSEFVVNGPRAHKSTQIANQKQHIIDQFNSYIPYLYHTVLDSELYAQFGQSFTLNPLPESFTFEEGTTTPSFSFTASFSDKDFYSTSTEVLPNSRTYPISIGDANLKMAFVPERWIFEGQMSSNIEGHGIVQDLNCKTRDSFSLTASVNHQRNSYEDGAQLSTSDVENELLALHQSVRDGFGVTTYEKSSTFNSGMHSFSLQKNYLAKTPIYSNFANNKFYGFLSANYNTRIGNHQFGF